jgi:hypothetical protein
MITRFIILLYILWGIGMPSVFSKTSEKDSLLRVASQLEKVLLNHPTEPTHQLELGRVYFYLAVDNEEFISKGDQHFRKMNQHSPNLKGEANIYLAAIHALRAKNATWPMDKWNLANKALSDMDKVVERYPNNIEIRFIRASTCYYLPFFFNRKDQVKSDFLILVNQLSTKENKYPVSLLKSICLFIMNSQYLEAPYIASLKNYFNSIKG